MRVRHGEQRGEQFAEPVGIAATPCFAAYAQGLEQGHGAGALFFEFGRTFRRLKARARLVLAAGAGMGPDIPECAAGHRMGDHQAQRDRRLARKACLRCAVPVQ
jgi:recombinational DNA repair protein (RecF pathway)